MKSARRLGHRTLLREVVARLPRDFEPSVATIEVQQPAIISTSAINDITIER